VALVVDASVGVKWLVAEADTEAAISLITTDELVAPDIFPIEVHNALATLVRRGLLMRSAAAHASAALEEDLPLLVRSTDILPRAFDFAIAFEHPVYDCLYLALAVQRDAQLVTADRRFFQVVVRDGRFKDRVRLLGLF
jgi:predicted nucleic acid-binding protein